MEEDNESWLSKGEGFRRAKTGSDLNSLHQSLECGPSFADLGQA